MPSRRRLRGLALSGTAAMVLVVAGCGSSSSSSSAPTKAQFVAKADAICKATGAKTAPLLSKLEAGGPALISGSATAARQLGAVVKELHAEGSSALAKLHALKQPTGEKRAIDGFLSPLSNVVGAAGQAATLLSSGQASAAIGLLAQVESQAQQATKAADAYGVAPCGSVVAAIG